VHKASNCTVGRKKLTDQSTVMNSCSQPDLWINHMQQGSRSWKCRLN